MIYCQLAFDLNFTNSKPYMLPFTGTYIASPLFGTASEDNVKTLRSHNLN